ncbi:hypothetical protein C4D60_Mb00t19710 [Musa balbisiana]|uniref:Uncharacterized protein n=1 Tax=Musa balbisiana TaxID=52838 RepID=A0A4S8I4H6_MUSBA|nr:hypothetical protein C4D60_Mb00t19710 [Musa balbisiana]
MQTASIPHPGRAADRLTPFRIAELSRRSHPLPPRQFQALFDSLFKFLFIFPLAVLFAAVSRPYLALAGITARLGLHSQTTRLVDSSSCAQVRADVALTPPRRPFPGTWARPSLRRVLQTTIRTTAAARFLKLC